MNPNDTKLQIAESFVDLARTMPLEKISVSDIVAASQKNRKTFYYHFTNKSYLLAWIFRYDLAQQLQQAVPGANLVYTSTDDKALDEFPYYTLIKDGVRSIDGAAFVHALIATFEARRSFYAQALADRSADGLNTYLRRLYVPALEEDVRIILNNRTLDERQVRFLAEFHLGALLDYLSAKLADRNETNIWDEFGPFKNILHASIADAITRHQQVRSL